MIGLAFFQFQEEHEVSPSSDEVMKKALQPLTGDEKTWICPSAKTGEESYKFLPEAFGKKMSDFKEPDKTPIATCQQHYNTLYADGHVEMK